jgi:DNA invertase Pin-like site-specific DNA recombinase
MAPTQRKATGLHAAIYARFSTDKQDVQSIADQVRVCTDWVTREGAARVTKYSDEGISGAAIGNRPGFLAMIEAARAREFQMLVVMELSRLSRSQADLAKTIDRLTFSGIRVVGVQDGYDSARKGHKLQSGLSGIIGEAFREMVADKTYAALNSRALTGRSTGGCPYGYRNIIKPDGTKWWEIVPEQAEVVRRIFTMYASGAGSKTIAYALNDDGVPSPGKSWDREKRRTDGKWHPSTIMGCAKKAVGILHNEVYVGRFVWNRSKWTKDPDTGVHKRSENPRSEWTVNEAPELRIVDDVLWQRVRQRQTDSKMRAVGVGNKSSKRGKPTVYLFSTLLRCSVCGSSFTMICSTKYGCSTRINCGKGSCSNDRRVVRTVAEARLLGSLREELLHGEYLKVWVAEAERQLRDVKAPDSKAVRARVAGLSRQIERMVAAIQDGTYSPALAEALRKAEAEKSLLMEQLEVQAAPAAPGKLGDSIQAQATDFAKMLQDLPAQLADPGIAFEARQALREWMGLIDIVPTPIGVEAHWSFAESGLIQMAGPRVAALSVTAL